MTQEERRFSLTTDPTIPKVGGIHLRRSTSVDVKNRERQRRDARYLLKEWHVQFLADEIIPDETVYLQQCKKIRSRRSS